MTNATAVSRVLRAGGMRPIPADRKFVWHGVNVTGPTARYASRGASVRVEAYGIGPHQEARLIIRAAEILEAAGYVLDRRTDASFVVTGKKASS